MKFDFKEKIDKLNKRKAIFTLLIILIVLYRMIFASGMGIFERKEKISSPSKIERCEKEEDAFSKINKELNKKNEEINKKITIYISGEVANPGVISIDLGQRLDDAIKKVGGLTKEADIERVNLAMKVEDAQHYIIPRKGENNQNKKDVNYSQTDENSNSQVSKKSSSKGSGKININLADENELESIPGVGPSTAKKIIDYRDKEGKFTNIEDIKNVSGIGDKKLENMKEYISTQ